MRLTIRDLEKIPHTRLLNGGRGAGKRFREVSTDSRTAGEGDLFVALRGERFDGHAFVAAAFARGALAAVVDEKFDVSLAESNALLVVGDTVRALGDLARVYRDKFRVPVLAVGGSNGKTTTKEMIGQVLAEKYSVLATEGNLNNHVGVPQTLFRLTSRHELAVVEMGTNHPGELAHLCRAVRPTHAILTNIGREHLEFFGTLEGVAREEGTLFESVREQGGGTAIVNADDPLVARAARGMKRVVTFGFAARNAMVRGRRIRLDALGTPQLEFRTPRMREWLGVQLRVPGAHIAANALAAVAAGVAFGVPAMSIRRALESFRAPTKRMEVLSVAGVTVLNDAYNANPDSTTAALRTLAAMKTTGKRIAVLGDMKELGDASAEAHTAVGREAATLKIDYVLTFGPMAKQIRDAAAMPGAIHYEQKNMLAEYLAELVTPGDVVLVKGSRSMRMEDIVTFLQERLHGSPPT
ncbi:MAG: UDP-N-acetylmuramoyl-tripeptide--D-alanyl-D-alanine ligase [Bacteroidota bacterium]